MIKQRNEGNIGIVEWPLGGLERIKEERKWTIRIRECGNWTFERPLHNRGSLYSYDKEVGKERGSTEHMMQLWEAGRNNGLNETEVGYERGEECAGDGLKHKIKC